MLSLAQWRFLKLSYIYIISCKTTFGVKRLHSTVPGYCISITYGWDKNSKNQCFVFLLWWVRQAVSTEQSPFVHSPQIRDASFGWWDLNACTGGHHSAAMSVTLRLSWTAALLKVKLHQDSWFSFQLCKESTVYVHLWRHCENSIQINFGSRLNLPYLPLQWHTALRPFGFWLRLQLAPTYTFSLFAK